MEYVVVASIISLGYLLSTKKIHTRNVVTNEKIPDNKLPNNSNQTEIIERNIHKRMSANYKKVFDNYDETTVKNKNNIVMPGPPKAFGIAEASRFNQVNTSTVPVEANQFESNNLIKEVNKRAEIPKFEIFNKPVDGNETGGFGGISLTGEPILRENFKHNNMVPFFGSTVKQNVDGGMSRTKFENFTGSQEHYRNKTEVRNMGDIGTNNSSQPYGSQSSTDFRQERMNISLKRNNVAPIEKINVGPGLNKGYTSQPTGGFQQADTREYVLPKTTDEIRVNNNPKVSYSGRIISGKRISVPGKIGVVSKNLPDSYYINNPDRYFTTTGAVLGPTVRSNILVKPTNRKKTSKYHVGPATNVQGSRSKKRDIKYKKDTKQTMSGFGWRNLEEAGRWIAEKFDYGKDTTNMKHTVRSDLADKNRLGNAGGATKSTLHNKNLRQTRKTNCIGNPRPTGNVEKSDYRGYVKDPNDVARTTMKETLIDNDRYGVVAPGKNKKTAYQNVKHHASETHRETTSVNYTGNAHGSNAEESREAMCNSSVKSLRDTVSRGRKPADSGAKKAISGDNIKMTTKKLGDLKNKSINKRGMMSTKTYNSLPQAEACGTTKGKNTLPNGPLQQRLDPSMLDALKNNPYNRSI